ncbi:hypothetical protein APD05_05885 [Acinetobacter nosocomialis]|uniref:hypothetical protein n=1 Tax=Acinetobacter nosocomialis TaxID=106654 RepID=UPI00029DDA42|nr:hypothetical protein [Acinetobacter nosocomialis]EKU61326.1 hypothetical protein ACINWC487_1018 [Acinetobacter nosocomialis]KQD11940.1 hypothetical protein APD05_01140 [Acinetobacter nosocomialis]KQD14377.1 hypothetical protein APD05_05885 [Acinetobacter nosocomialis]MCU4575300.1 hypothetical protein [Acinetobacter nosocomialis]MCU4593513.1 hypothetical protein [Acinetobacter nosocomialis]
MVNLKTRASKLKPNGATHFHYFDKFIFYAIRGESVWQYGDDGIWRIRKEIIKAPMIKLY